MSTITFVKKTPAGALGNFNWEYKCKCKTGKDKENVVVTTANENQAKILAQAECDELCGEA